MCSLCCWMRMVRYFRIMQMIRRINPIAKVMAESRRRTSTKVVPDKKKYNRNKDKDNANKNRKDEITED